MSKEEIYNREVTLAQFRIDEIEENLETDEEEDIRANLKKI